MMSFRRILPAFLLIFTCGLCRAQSSDGIIQMFRPISIATGVPLGGEGRSYAGDDGNLAAVADVKFQFSFAIPLWRDIGGVSGRYLFIGYSQQCLWNFYGKSSPMRDNSFIPGIYMNLPWKNNNLLVGIEHRSNGRPFAKTSTDGNEDYSRSLNHLLAEYTHSFDFGLSLQASVRAGYAWYNNELCQDLYYRYYGYATLSAMYESPGKKFWALASVTPTFAPFGANANVEVAWSPFKHPYLPSFFLQGCCGWDCAMCDWVRGEDRPAPRVRIGLMFTPGAAFRMSR